MPVYDNFYVCNRSRSRISELIGISSKFYSSIGRILLFSHYLKLKRSYKHAYSRQYCKYKI